jgi:hypothetical protein
MLTIAHMTEPRCLIEGDGDASPFQAGFVGWGKWFRQVAAYLTHGRPPLAGRAPASIDQKRNRQRLAAHATNSLPGIRSVAERRLRGSEVRPR